MTADVTTLEEERDFLLRSLRDLEAERAAGDISDDDYQSLKDDYTARAASVIRAIRAAQAPRRTAGSGTAAAGAADLAELAPPRLSWKTPVTVLVVVAFAVVCGWAVASTAGDRTPGQSVTGSLPSAGSAGSSASPVQAKLAEAQQLIGQKKVLDAVKTYDEILKTNPQQPEALAYRGWLLYLAGLGQQGLDSVTKATQADPSYPDAHFFRGQMVCEMNHDDAGAAAEFREYLSRFDPSQQGMVPMVEARLKSALNGECSKPGQAPPVTAPPPTTGP